MSSVADLTRINRGSWRRATNDPGQPPEKYHRAPTGSRGTCATCDAPLDAVHRKAHYRKESGGWRAMYSVSFGADGEQIDVDQPPDIDIVNHSSIWTITAITSRGREWMQANIDGCSDDSVIVEHRAGHDIYEGAKAAGLVVTGSRG